MKTELIRWLRAAGIRALRTMAQTAAATLSTSAYLHDIDWPLTVSATLMAGLLSILMALGGLPETGEAGGR